MQKHNLNEKKKKKIGLPEASEVVNPPRSTLNCHVKKKPAFEKLHKIVT
jgi:hypothetical protein